MFSGILLLLVALFSLAGFPAAAAAAPTALTQALVNSRTAPVVSHETCSPSEPSTLEEEQEEQEDLKSHTPEPALDWPLSPALCGAALSLLEVPRGEPFVEVLRFAISLGTPRGPPARS